MGGQVYILANRYRGTTHVGVTADIARQTWQHRESGGSSFATRYGARRLVHVEPFERVEETIAREKVLKKWRRDWKIELIERGNPEWLDPFDRINAQEEARFPLAPE